MQVRHRVGYCHRIKMYNHVDAQQSTPDTCPASSIHAQNLTFRFIDNDQMDERAISLNRRYNLKHHRNTVILKLLIVDAPPRVDAPVCCFRQKRAYSGVNAPPVNKNAKKGPTTQKTPSFHFGDERPGAELAFFLKAV